MDSNQLYQIALSDAADDVILSCLPSCQVARPAGRGLFAFFDAVKAPIAIRSSSLLEDSHYQPFAGIYSNLHDSYLDDKYEMLRMLRRCHQGSICFRIL